MNNLLEQLFPEGLPDEVAITVGNVLWELAMIWETHYWLQRNRRSAHDDQRNPDRPWERVQRP